MTGLTRYLRLWLAFGRYGLARELAFRGNFLVKITVELLWLSILLVFYRTVFAQTKLVAGWSEPEYLFFVGCYYALEGIIETLFLENCSEFADLIRSGDLDVYLLRPIDEQFLLTCRTIDWSTAPNVLLGSVVMGIALFQIGRPVEPAYVLSFVVLFICATALAYSFLLVLTSTSMWFMRNQSILEMWWLFTSLMRYPREIFNVPGFSAVGLFFSFVVPILLVVYVPAQVMAKRAFDPVIVGSTLAATVVLLIVSRKFFRYVLRLYRSASS